MYFKWGRDSTIFLKKWQSYRELMGMEIMLERSWVKPEPILSYHIKVLFPGPAVQVQVSNRSALHLLSLDPSVHNTKPLLLPSHFLNMDLGDIILLNIQLITPMFIVFLVRGFLRFLRFATKDQLRVLFQMPQEEFPIWSWTILTKGCQCELRNTRLRSRTESVSISQTDTPSR